jgi:hypothetical protein
VADLSISPTASDDKNKAARPVEPPEDGQKLPNFRLIKIASAVEPLIGQSMLAETLAL